MACIRLAVTALAVLAQVYGESPAVKISVTDPAALPVANARVTVRSTFGGAPIERSTDEHGGVIVTPPSAGRYLVLIAVEGFAEESRYFDWKNEAASLEIRLAVSGLQEQVTITSGSRLEELQQDSPVDVEAVSRQAMMNTGYERLSDVLAEVPGVVTRSGSSGAVGSEQIRAISARQVAVLQDGLPMIGARGIKSGNINLNRPSTGRLERL